MAAKEAVDDEDVYKIRPNYRGNLPPGSPTKAYLLRGARQSPSASRPSSAKGSSSGGSISSAGCGTSWTRVYREQQARRWLIKQQRAKQQHADGRVWAMAGAGGEGCGESYNAPAMRGGALNRPHSAPTAQTGPYCASQDQLQRFAIVGDADHMPFHAVQMPPRYYSQIDSTRRNPPRVARCLQSPSSQAQIGGELSVRPVGGGVSSAAGGPCGAVCCRQLLVQQGASARPTHRTAPQAPTRQRQWRQQWRLDESASSYASWHAIAVSYGMKDAYVPDGEDGSQVQGPPHQQRLAVSRASTPRSDSIDDLTAAPTAAPTATSTASASMPIIPTTPPAAASTPTSIVSLAASHVPSGISQPSDSHGGGGERAGRGGVSLAPRAVGPPPEPRTMQQLAEGNRLHLSNALACAEAQGVDADVTRRAPLGPTGYPTGWWHEGGGGGGGAGSAVEWSELRAGFMRCEGAAAAAAVGGGGMCMPAVRKAPRIDAGRRQAQTQAQAWARASSWRERPTKAVQTVAVLPTNLVAFGPEGVTPCHSRPATHEARGWEYEANRRLCRAPAACGRSSAASAVAARTAPIATLTAATSSYCRVLSPAPRSSLHARRYG